MAMLVGLLALFLLQGAAYSQPQTYSQQRTFDFIADSNNLPGLQVDSTGRSFLAADNYLYRLDAQLVQEERVDLGAIVANRGLALSSTGMVVVCLVDLSCSVYNASNLSAGAIRNVGNAITSADQEIGTAIFTSGDTFYTGTGGTKRMLLQQFAIGEGFNRSSDNNPSGSLNELVFETSNFKRTFYAFGGFVSGGFAYYVVVDTQPVDARAIRLLRVCNKPDCGGPSTCGVTALYELGFDCGFEEVLEDTSLSAVSLVEDFSRISGPTAVMTIGNLDVYCMAMINVTAVNEAMDAKYDSCIVSRTVGEEIGLKWKLSSSCDTLPQSQVCSTLHTIHMHNIIIQVTGDRCDTPSPVGLLSNADTIAPNRVKFGGKPIPLALIALKVEQFSLVFMATPDSTIRGVSACS